MIENETINSAGQVGGSCPRGSRDCMPGPPRAPTAGAPDVQSDAPPPDSLDTCFARLTSEGYEQRLVVQPVSHFWPLQWAETGLYGAASLLLAGLSFWWTRRMLS